MVLGLRNVGDTYQNVLDISSEGDYDAYMDSLCNSGTKWIGCGTNKTVRRIDLCPDSKAWYQFIKHSLRLIAHNEFLSKARHDVPEKSTNEVYHPQATFDKIDLKTLMKPKGRKIQVVGCHEALEEETTFEIDRVLRGVLLQI
ncbi:hypothetical protein KIW84_058411 [Lathyrus oleraceus]|uniref:Uncharacterized protein n=1 Tax=Pisum sativum TaxID=3888 RepID=A0A9D4X4X0_PEA|nr:hypothetical protein KIW84_058411 [Pisum sativum]